MTYMFNQTHYYSQTYLKTLDKYVREYENMLLMVEEGIRGGICQAVQHYESANNKYMKDYNENVISSYLQYLDANNFYGWAVSKKLPIGEFRWAKKPSIYTEQAIKMCDENND